jgi:hypothetical protein
MSTITRSVPTLQNPIIFCDKSHLTIDYGLPKNQRLILNQTLHMLNDADKLGEYTIMDYMSRLAFQLLRTFVGSKNTSSKHERVQVKTA